ncbi:NADPH:quinone reductase [Kitasatospora indigofera]|uniref:NADPH:quinone reductase n=1 Tax=Kitasatospora indigofera TaxID=67307 RepID=A0A919FEM5_9ACTN|nr:NAD(P)-dependent alcohol dehydrogenase [Kitasatospora indigofera]GHH63570.1 NADPH:quinone reductase [Kitasatospora indigofera]
MKAVVQDSYGPPEVLELREVERPVPGPGEVLVRVRAAGLDPGVGHLTTGLPYLVRLGVGLRAPRVRTRGMDVSGQVTALGPEVTGLRVGDEVFGTCAGSFAEYAVVRQDRCAPKPANLTFEQAAVVPVSAVTALRALRDAGRVRPGQHVLVIGAGGGVGSFATQLAKAFGAEVTGLCGPAKAELVRSLGADHVSDYTREDFADGPRRYDLIVDTAGNRPLSRLRRALTPRGTLVIVGGEHDGRWLGGTDRALRALLLSPFVRQRLRGLLAVPGRADLGGLAGLIEAGRVTPLLDRSFRLDEVPRAVRYLAGGHARGKVAITMAGPAETGPETGPEVTDAAEGPTA